MDNPGRCVGVETEFSLIEKGAKRIKSDFPYMPDSFILSGIRYVAKESDNGNWWWLNGSLLYVPNP